MYTIYADDTLLYSPGDEELSVLSPVLETQCNAAAVQRPAQNADAD